MMNTPGPWTVTVRRGRVIVLDANRNEVCDAYAAAPLIAAAPDLLAALRQMEEWAEQIDDENSRVPIQIRIMARAAIARATNTPEN